ncbi:NAD-dependent epimerase/dehydratase family protein [uncultured Methylobacterium sp.]|uniref:NAD-dependent epimerase/dehydratase family protein n=1 Tax=uncultured Methylobacterium sp. TaxID=157278 RepID=UPI0035CBF56B
MRRILVTGAAGFVGRHILAALASGAGPSDRIVGIGRGRFDGPPEGAAFRQIDLLDAAAVSACVAEYRPTDVLHLAGMASVQQSADAPTELWRANVVGLLNLADAVARFAAGSNLVFASSGEVYGRAFLTGGAVGEDVEPMPLGNYARSKWFGEQILLDVLPKAGVRLVILRLFNHIGPGQDERFVVPSFAGQIARIEAGLAPPMLEVGNLDARRDFLPIGDVVRAYVDLLDNVDGIPSGSVFNVCSGLPRSIGSILSDLTGLSRVPFEVRVAQDRMRPSEIAIAAGDASRLKAAMAWEPTQDWHAALAEILDEARAQVSYRTGPTA